MSFSIVVTGLHISASSAFIVLENVFMAVRAGGPEIIVSGLPCHAIVVAQHQLLSSHVAVHPSLTQSRSAPPLTASSSARSSLSLMLNDDFQVLSKPDLRSLQGNLLEYLGLLQGFLRF